MLGHKKTMASVLVFSLSLPMPPPLPSLTYPLSALALGKVVFREPYGEAYMARNLKPPAHSCVTELGRGSTKPLSSIQRLQPCKRPRAMFEC